MEADLGGVSNQNLLDLIDVTVEERMTWRTHRLSESEPIISHG